MDSFEILVLELLFNGEKYEDILEHRPGLAELIEDLALLVLLEGWTAERVRQFIRTSTLSHGPAYNPLPPK